MQELVLENQLLRAQLQQLSSQQPSPCLQSLFRRQSQPLQHKSPSSLAPQELLKHDLSRGTVKFRPQVQGQQGSSLGNTHAEEALDRSNNNEGSTSQTLCPGQSLEHCPPTEGEERNARRTLPADDVRAHTQSDRFQSQPLSCGMDSAQLQLVEELRAELSRVSRLLWEREEERGEHLAQIEQLKAHDLSRAR